MRKSFLYCILILAISMLLISCGSNNNSTNTANTTKTEKAIEQSTEALVTTDSEESLEASVDLIELSPEEQFDNVVSYFNTSGKAGKKRHSWTTDASYYVGFNEKDDQIQFMYISDDDSQGVLLTLDREGNFGITVKIISANEGVIGTSDMKAEDYTYGYEFADFSYQSEQRDWDYDKFKLRANTYVRNTMLYAEGLLQDYLEISLKDLGFSSWQNPGMYKDGIITSQDVAGMWDYESSDEKSYSSKLYLTENKIYWQGYEEKYADEITPSEMTESEDYLISQDMVMSMTDPYTGEVVIVDNYIGNDDSVEEQFRRYIYRGDDGKLFMRIESVYMGLSNHEDGKIYVKTDDNETVTISPELYYPGMETDENPNNTEETKKDGTALSQNNSTYQSILDEYTSKMNKAVPGLIQEYETATAGISDINRLAEICNAKVGELAEICNEGIGKMADLMYSKGDSYSTYESWAGKLMDNYSEIAQEIQDAYLDSATAW